MVTVHVTRLLLDKSATVPVYSIACIQQQHESCMVTVQVTRLLLERN
jgi:hypothetical protein